VRGSHARLALLVVVVLSWLLSSVGPVAAQAYSLNSRVKMTDGVELSTDVWRNIFDDTPRPVLLRRTPYGRALNAAEASRLFAAGFIVVSQDVRGRGDSDGDYLPFFNDKSDGRDTVDWIAAQDWSNGRVGTYSTSTEGILQHLLMAAAPAALSCVHVTMGSHDVYEAFFPGGAWRTDFGTNWLRAINESSVVDTFKAHEVHDDYWKVATLSNKEMAKIDHPVFMLGGLFDIFAPSQGQAAEALPKNVAAASRGDVFVVLGPWTHTGLGQSRQGQLLYPDEAAMASWLLEQLQFFNWCLKGAGRPPFANVRYYQTELTDETKVDSVDNQTRLVVKGGWHESKQWPPPETKPATLYLQGEHALMESVGDSDPIVLPVDPADPTPSRGGGNFAASAGPYDQLEVDARPDVYTSTSGVFEQDTELVGTPRAFVWAASATTDVDVVVRLEAVTPGGHAILMSDGVRRGRFIGGYDVSRALIKGMPALFEVELGPLALRVPRGHAIRVALSGSSSPRYEPNPNVATPLAQAPTPQKTTLTIFRDREHTTRIELPLLSGKLTGVIPVVVPPDAGVPTLDAGVALPPVREAGVRPDEPRDAAAKPTGTRSPDRQPADADVPVLADEDASTPRRRAAAGCSCSSVDDHALRGLHAPGLAFALLVLGTRHRKRRTAMVAREESP
jgi:MYXO-CTERM domain-containing protein